MRERPSPHLHVQQGRGGKAKPTDEPIPSPTRLTPSGPSAPSLRKLSIHVNAWGPFKEKWASAGEFREFEAVTAILLQEHRLQTRDQCRDAEDWCSRRGWNAMFAPATAAP